MSTIQDIEQHAELLVTEYLKSWHCSRSLEMFSSKVSSRPAPSAELLETYHADTARRVNAEDRCASLLEFMIRGAKLRVAQSPVESVPTPNRVDASSRRRRTSSESDGAGIGEWSKQDVSTLKKAIKQTATVEDKNLRWKQIAGLVGNDKSKKQCYLKYKQLKEEQKSTGESDKAGGSSRRRTSKDSGANRDSSKSESDMNLVAPIAEQGFAASSPSSSEKSFASSPKALANPKQKLAEVDTATFIPVATSLSRESSAASDTLEMEDCETFDAPTVSMQPVRNAGRPISIRSSAATGSTTRGGVAPTAEQIASVRQLLFGKQDEGKTFNSHWTEQVGLQCIITTIVLRLADSNCTHTGFLL